MAREQAGDARGAAPEVLEGELVESTERALMAMSVTGAATLDTSMVAILTRAELDQMVVTARANPRSIQRALEATKEIACLNIQSATECGYALPRGRDDTTGKANVITGPSVRLAEIVAICWGNGQAASRVTEVNRTEGWVEAEGVFIDFQTNFRVTARVRRSIRGKSKDGKPGRLFNDDMINVTSNAATAIAYRNAIFKGIPKPIWNTAYEATKAIVRGDEKSLGARRVDLLTAFRDNLNIPPEKVYAILGVKGEADIGLDEIVIAAGFYSALKNNEVTLDDLLRQIQPAGTPKTLGAAFDAPDHDPDTGVVREDAPQGAGDKPAAAGPATEQQQAQAPKPLATEPKKPAAEAKGADVILNEPAPPGVTYFWTGSDVLDDNGKRQTFKDGKAFSKQKPSSGLPIYAEHSVPGALPKDPQGAAPAAGTGSPAAEAAKPASPAGTATAAGAAGTGGLTSEVLEDEGGEPAPAKGETHLLWGEKQNGMGQLGIYRDGKLVGYATPDGARAASMKTYTAQAAGVKPLPDDNEFPGDRPTQMASAPAAAAGRATSASAGPASSASADQSASGQENWEPDPDVDMDELPGAAEAEEEEESLEMAGAGVDAADEGPAEPEAFREFREKLATLDSWLTIKAALSALRKSDDWKADDKGRWRVAARRMAFDLVEALRGAKKDPVDPRSAPDYFAAWVEFAPVGDLQGVWQRLITSKAYQGLRDELKDNLADAFEDQRARSA